jgi:transcriptional regulator GlxA family with amidase domain
MAADRLHTVAVVAYDGVAVFELAVPCEVFGIDRSDMGVPNYRLLVCGVEPGPVKTGGGFTMTPSHTLRALSQADTIVVPSWKDVEQLPPRKLIEALQRAHRRGARIASLCSGAFVLAHAGLLDGKRATTHWMHSAALAAHFPDVDVDPSVLYVDEGDVLTSAGTAAGIDLCLHMVRKDYGADVANVFARRMVVPPHRDGGQAQFLEAPVPVCDGDDVISPTMAWALEHLDESITVEMLAARAAVSPRTYARRFKATAGTTPLQWLLQQRLAAAQRLLETTDIGVEHVADRSGFGTAAALRIHFNRNLGVAPLAYRQTFRRAG